MAAATTQKKISDGSNEEGSTAFWKCFRSIGGIFKNLLVKPIFKLLQVKLPIYVIFLGTVCLLFVSQCAIIYSNHSIFMKLTEVVDVISPMHQILLEGQDGSLSLSTASDELGNAEVPNEKKLEQDPSEDSVFFSNISHDYRQCTSPESNVPWPLEGDINSKTSEHLTCGFDADTPFANFFRGALWKRKFEPLTSRCKNLAVFGVAFGGNFVSDLDAHHVKTLINSTDFLNRHGNCFFILTTEEDIENNAAIINKYNSEDRNFLDPVVIGHNILIPLPSDILPYTNPRRNVKLLKYAGQYMFPETETVIWQDAKFFRDDFVSKQPRDYSAMVDQDTCVTAIGLPVHKITVGQKNIEKAIKKYGDYTAQYKDHCSTIIDALKERPDVTDSSENLINQCDAYLQHVHQQDGNIEILNQGLIDSAFIVWNHKTQACRDFSRSFRCTIADQIHCHADRDQVSIPFAMYKMGVAPRYRQHKDADYTKVDKLWNPRIHDLDFVLDQDKASSGNQVEKTIDEGVKIRITRSSCHWYFSRLGACRTDLSNGKPTVALFIAGTAKRYVFQGLTEHFIKPLVEQQNTNVDYFLMLSVKQGLAYRSSDEFIKYQTYDPAFKEISAERDSSTVTAYLFDEIRNSITHSGASVGGIHIQPQPMKLDPSQLRSRQIEAKKARPREDSYYRFPTLDLRPEFRRRTAVTNRNLFKLYLGVQKLWDKHLTASETHVGVIYDYVILLKDDATWLADFNLQKLLDTNPHADAYVLSCDQRDPPIIAKEYSDIGIVIKRNKAKVLGRYFEEILHTNLQECHDSVKDMVPSDTGCNNGMLLYHILKKNNVIVERVPQSVFPIERTFNLLRPNGTTARCIHSVCQSSESPLEIPDNVKNCHEIELL